MQGGDEGAGGGAASEESESSPGGPGSLDGHGGHQDSRIGGLIEARASPTRGPPVARALPGPGPGADASPGPGGLDMAQVAGSTAESPEILLFHCTLKVPLSSALHAEMARQFMTPRIQPHTGAVSRELGVAADFLMIRLTAEDPGQLQIALNSCLHQLSIFIGTAPNILHPVFYFLP